MMTFVSCSETLFGMQQETAAYAGETATNQRIIKSMKYGEQLYWRFFERSTAQSKDPLVVSIGARRKELKKKLFNILVSLPWDITALIADYDIYQSDAHIGLNGQPLQCVRTLVSTCERIQCLLGLLKGGFASISYPDPRLDIWDENGELTACFLTGMASINCLAQLSDGLLFAGGAVKDDKNNLIKALFSCNPLDKKTGRITPGDAGNIVCMTTVGGEIKTALAYGCDDGALVYCVPSNGYKRILRERGALITALARIGKQGLLASGLQDGKINLWNCKAPKSEPVLIKTIDMNKEQYSQLGETINVLAPLFGDDSVSIGSSESRLLFSRSFEKDKPTQMLNCGRNIKAVQQLSNGLWVIAFIDGTFMLFDQKKEKIAPLGLGDEQKTPEIFSQFTILHQPRDWIVTAEGNEIKLWR